MYGIQNGVITIAILQWPAGAGLHAARRMGVQSQHHQCIGIGHRPQLEQTPLCHAKQLVIAQTPGVSALLPRHLIGELVNADRLVKAVSEIEIALACELERGAAQVVQLIVSGFQQVAETVRVGHKSTDPSHRIAVMRLLTIV